MLPLQLYSVVSLQGVTEDSLSGTPWISVTVSQRVMGSTLTLSLFLAQPLLIILKLKSYHAQTFAQTSDGFSSHSPKQTTTRGLFKQSTRQYPIQPPLSMSHFFSHWLHCSQPSHTSILPNHTALIQGLCTSSLA